MLNPHDPYDVYDCEADGAARQGALPSDLPAADSVAIQHKIREDSIFIGSTVDGKCVAKWELHFMVSEHILKGGYTKSPKEEHRTSRFGKKSDERETKTEFNCECSARRGSEKPLGGGSESDEIRFLSYKYRHKRARLKIRAAHNGYFEVTPGPVAQARVDDLLAWWNRLVFLPSYEHDRLNLCHQEDFWSCCRSYARIPSSRGASVSKLAAQRKAREAVASDSYHIL
jgi:hypothetical protein